MTTNTEARRGSPKAPDWGINYGIKELWSEVLPGLFVGGTADDDTVDFARTRLRGGGIALEDGAIMPEDFDAVVTMYAYAQPVDWEVEELRWGIYDSDHHAIDFDALRDTVVWAHRRWKAGKKVLVRCQAGLNRSSLVAALVMVRDGMDGAEAIARIRRGRSPHALFNTRFEKLVRAASYVDVDFWREGV